MSRYYSDDPIADFERWDRDQQKLLDKLPRCYACEEPIQDDVCYCFNGHKYCLDCKDAAADDILPEFLEATV